MIDVVIRGRVKMMHHTKVIQKGGEEIYDQSEGLRRNKVGLSKFWVELKNSHIMKFLK